MMRARLAALSPHAGPGEIPAIDGLRALAALSVVGYHVLVLSQGHVSLGPVDVHIGLNYLQVGVHLFFVLSGFLLFQPYARAMLQDRPWPSPLRFYLRRALRILPAYWVCLAVLVVVITLFGLHGDLAVADPGSVVAHLALLHDEFPRYANDIEGPFWTLTLEWQFYLLLPLIAAGLARLVGTTRSAARLVWGLLGMIALALALREVAAVAQVTLSPVAAAADAGSLDGQLAQTGLSIVFVITGAQGKFLEVFGLGMLCSTLYVMWSGRPSLRARLSPALMLCGLALACVLAPWLMQVQIALARPWYSTMRPTAVETVAGPFLLGLDCSLLVLGVVLGGSRLRAIFEQPVTRFLGVISYSIYLWHLPLLLLAGVWLSWATPGVRAVGLILAVLVLVLPVSYLSYQVVERPFLKRRTRLVAPVPVAVRR